MRSLLLAAIAVFCAQPAVAAEIVQTTSNQSVPNPSTFAGFDASLGTLTGVTLDIIARESRPGWIVGFVTEPGTLSWVIDGVSTFSLRSMNVAFAEFAVPIFGEGSHDYTRNGPFTMRATGQATFNIDPTLISANSFYASFTGPGFYDSSDVTFTGGNAIQQLGQGGDLSWNNHSFKLTYTYTPFGAVPEPSIWFMMILGFGLIGGVMRVRVSARHAPAG